MADCVIIADDLTGANATGALLQNQLYSVYRNEHGTFAADE